MQRIRGASPALSGFPHTVSRSQGFLSHVPLAKKPGFSPGLAFRVQWQERRKEKKADSGSLFLVPLLGDGSFLGVLGAGVATVAAL